MSGPGNKEIFSKNLKYYMDLYQKDRMEICKVLGFRYSTFTDWINGNAYPRIDKIEILANYFHIQKSDLIEDPTLKKARTLYDSMCTKGENQVAMIPIYRTFDSVTPDNCLEGYMATDCKLIQTTEVHDYFYYRLQDESLNLKFTPNSILLFHKQKRLVDDDIGIFLIPDNTVVIRRFKKENNLILLQPMSNNIGFSTDVYDLTKDSIQIIGKAILHVSML